MSSVCKPSHPRSMCNHDMIEMQIKRLPRLLFLFFCIDRNYVSGTGFDSSHLPYQVHTLYMDRTVRSSPCPLPRIFDSLSTDQYLRMVASCILALSHSASFREVTLAADKYFNVGRQQVRTCIILRPRRPWICAAAAVGRRLLSWLLLSDKLQKDLVSRCTFFCNSQSS